MDATLLPSPSSRFTSEGEPGSTRCLADIGVEAVLGAMIEQKRRASDPGDLGDSSDSSGASGTAVQELAASDLEDADDTAPHPASRARRGAAGAGSAVAEVFVKAR